MIKEKTLFHTRQKIAALFLWVVALSPLSSQADQFYTYYIDRDENGLFIHTEHDGSYYLEIGSDTHAPRKGQAGSYYLLTDGNEKYIVTSRHGKFLINSSTTDGIEITSGYSDNSNLVRETKIVINGDQILVPALIRVGAKKAETLLLLDTGATLVALHTEFAKKLKLRSQKKSKIMVAGGKVIKADLGILESIAVGPIRIENLPVCILDSHNGLEPYEGILGMNFLRNANYRIDFKKQLILWDAE